MLVNIQKCPQMPSQSIYFSNFSGRGIPQLLTIGKLCILIVLCAITRYSQSKALFYLCDHARFRKPSRKLPMGMIYFEWLCMYISDCAPPLESLDLTLRQYQILYLLNNPL